MTRKILVVDDEEDIAVVLRDRLEAYGFDVRLARSGVEALRQLAAEKFDAVLMDVRLPELDGIGALEALRRSDTTTPVIICTAFSDRSLADEAMAKGANDYLVKPFSVDDLKSKLERLYNTRL